MLSSSFCNLLQLIVTSFVLISCSEKCVSADFLTTGFKSARLSFCTLIFQAYHKILGTHDLTQSYTVRRSCHCLNVRSHNCVKRLLASSCLSVCPSVRVKLLGSYWTDFHEILYVKFYINKIQQDATVCRYLFTAK